MEHLIRSAPQCKIAEALQSIDGTISSYTFCRTLLPLLADDAHDTDWEEYDPNEEELEAAEALLDSFALHRDRGWMWWAGHQYGATAILYYLPSAEIAWTILIVGGDAEQSEIWSGVRSAFEAKERFNEAMPPYSLPSWNSMLEELAMEQTLKAEFNDVEDEWFTGGTGWRIGGEKGAFVVVVPGEVVVLRAYPQNEAPGEYGIETAILPEKVVGEIPIDDLEVEDRRPLVSLIWSALRTT